MIQNPYVHVIQYYETDQMNCVHHSNYIRWFEEARTDFMRQMGFGYDVMEEKGVMSPVIKVAAEYNSMARFGESVSIHTSVGNYTGSRITFHYEIYDKDTSIVRCRGETFHCFINRQGRPVSLKKYLPEMDEKIIDLKSEKVVSTTL